MFEDGVSIWLLLWLKEEYYFLGIEVEDKDIFVILQVSYFCSWFYIILDSIYWDIFAPIKDLLTSSILVVEIVKAGLIQHLDVSFFLKL